MLKRKPLVGRLDIGRGYARSGRQAKDISPMLALRSRKRLEARERRAHERERAVPQLGAARFDDVMDSLQVVRDGHVAVNRNADLHAVPHKPNGNSGVARLLRAERAVARYDQPFNASAAIAGELAQAVLHVAQRGGES